MDASRTVEEKCSLFEKVISLENLFSAWSEFRSGKCGKKDVAEFEVELFASINHEKLMCILQSRTKDGRLLSLLENIIESYDPGLPLGNLTSQLFANIYLDQLDRYVKHKLRIQGYIRYADDIVLLHTDKRELLIALWLIEKFLWVNLGLRLNSSKTQLKTFANGIDFLGYVCFPCFRILRTKTKRRLLKRATYRNFASYCGVLKHCRSRGILLKCNHEMGEL